MRVVQPDELQAFMLHCGIRNSTNSVMPLCHWLNNQSLRDQPNSICIQFSDYVEYIRDTYVSLNIAEYHKSPIVSKIGGIVSPEIARYALEQYDFGDMSRLKRYFCGDLSLVIVSQYVNIDLHYKGFNVYWEMPGAESLTDEVILSHKQPQANFDLFKQACIPYGYKIGVVDQNIRLAAFLYNNYLDGNAKLYSRTL